MEKRCAWPRTRRAADGGRARRVPRTTRGRVRNCRTRRSPLLSRQASRSKRPVPAGCSACASARLRYGQALELLASSAETRRRHVPRAEGLPPCRGHRGELYRQLGQHAVARDHDRLPCRPARENRASTVGSVWPRTVGLGDAAAARTELTVPPRWLRAGRVVASAGAPRLGCRQRSRCLPLTPSERPPLRTQLLSSRNAPALPVTWPRACCSASLRSKPAGLTRPLPPAAARSSPRASTLPLQWPTRAVLGTLLAESNETESERSLAAARRRPRPYLQLPDGLRDQWRSRPDVSALLGG